MSANETLFVDDAEIIDLINEANQVVDKLNLVTFTEEYEKKCQAIFTELDKDLSNWGKNIRNYMEKVNIIQQLEEGVKHDLIERLDLTDVIQTDIKKFEDRLKQLKAILQENIKVNCGDLISNEEIKKLGGLEEEIDTIRELLSYANENFDEIADAHKEAVKSAKILQQSSKLLENITGLEGQLNNIQRQILRNGVKKIELEDTN